MNIKKIGYGALLCCLAANGLLIARPESVFGSRVVWAHNKLPSTRMERLVKGLGAFLGGGGLSYFIASLRYSAVAKTRIGLTLLGALVGAFSYSKISAGNTVDIWVDNFSKEFARLNNAEELSPQAFDGTSWQLPFIGLADVLLRLKNIGNELAELVRVAGLLLDCRSSEMTNDQLQCLKVGLVRLADLQKICGQRYAWVAAAVDYQEFSRLYNAVFGAPELMETSGDSWMRSAAGDLKTYESLVHRLQGLKNSLVCMQDVANNLLGVVHAATIKAEVKADVLNKMYRYPRLKDLCESRLAFCRAQFQYESLCSEYYVLVHSLVLQQSPVDDEAWMKRFGLLYDVALLGSELNEAKNTAEQIILQGDGLLKRDVVIHLTQSQVADISVKVLASRDLLKVILQRQKIVAALILVKEFNEEYARLVSLPVVAFGRQVQTDLSWMQVTQGQEWPLEAVLKLLEDVKKDFLYCIARSERLLRKPELSSLKDSYILEIHHKVGLLQQALDLVNQRILFVRHSALYAQELQAKQARAEALLLERNRREAEERARREQQERDRLNQLQAQQRPAVQVVVPTAPPLDEVQPVGILPVTPTAPPLDEYIEPVLPAGNANSFECFCGDSVPENEVYVLACSCKNSGYHKDCIRQWVNQSKNCPTCRARVTLADIFKKNDSTVAQPVVAPVVPSAPPAQEVLSAQPVSDAQDDDRECYLCMDAVGDCTTANCDCTVKKAACRACLQEWINSHHTCPRCQKQGATLIDMPAQ
ncbi:hypothetical protein FJ366_03985 [Candidatus Dependentiae bacterium]|nr:hypothetical protein [Candidatus Dependentiae bacterium]